MSFLIDRILLLLQLHRLLRTQERQFNELRAWIVRGEDAINNDRAAYGTSRWLDMKLSRHLYVAQLKKSIVLNTQIRALEKGNFGKRATRHIEERESELYAANAKALLLGVMAQYNGIPADSIERQYRGSAA